MKKTHLAALAVASLFIAWMLSGVLTGREAASTAPSLAESRDSMVRQQQDTPTRVRASVLHAQPQRAAITVRGRTEANRRVSVRAETSGLITELPAAKGDRVAAGDALCRIDPGSRPERLEESRQAVEHARIEYAGAQQLEERGLLSATGIAAARARLATARAELRQRELEFSHTVIRAPFAGIVEERPVDLGDFLQAGGVCAEILDPDPMLLVGQVPERDVARLGVGDAGGGRLLTGEEVAGRISYVASAAHPNTRTFRVEVSVPNADASLRDGITTELLLPVEEHMAHHIPASVLALDDAGEIGVRILDDQDTVRFARIRIIRDSDNGLWVTGLPESVTLITVGQEMVVPGERVIPVFDDGIRPPDSTASANHRIEGQDSP